MLLWCFLLCQAAAGVCTVFVHINKSGGQTVKSALYRQHSRSKVGLCSEREYASDQCLKSLPYAGRDSLDGWVILGDSAMVLSDRLHNKCTWITIFREPASRLVSSLRFCERSRSDHLCGSSVLDARDANIETWAQHQRGFVYLRLALSDTSLPRVAVAPTVKNRVYDDDDLRWTTTVPTWIQHQRAVLHRDAQDDPMLAKIKADLAAGRLIHGVGILERPEDTAAVFDLIVPIEGGWARLFKTSKFNAASAPVLNDPLLIAARSDPNVTRHL